MVYVFNVVHEINEILLLFLLLFVLMPSTLLKRSMLPTLLNVFGWQLF